MEWRRRLHALAVAPALLLSAFLSTPAQASPVQPGLAAVPSAALASVRPMPAGWSRHAWHLAHLAHLRHLTAIATVTAVTVRVPSHARKLTPAQWHRHHVLHLDHLAHLHYLAQYGGSQGGAPVLAQGTAGQHKPAPAALANYSSPQSIASAMLGSYGWGQGQMGCLIALWNQESGWNVYATNPGSGAYGIPQSLPADKMASAGADWRTNPATQIKWGLQYLRDTYGSPCGGEAHELAAGWY